MMPQPHIMRNNFRAGYVRFQQGLAREALFRGSLGAARMALRVLHTSDFADGAAVSATSLAVLRNPRATEDELRAAVHTLLELGPAGGH